MDARYLDHYSYLDSPVHRIHAATKLLVAAILALLSLFVPLSFLTFHIVLILFLAGIAFIARLPLLHLIRRLRWVWLLILILSLGRLLHPGGWYAVLITFFWLGETLLIVTLLLGTTRFADLLEVLARLGIPQSLVTGAALIYRFLFVLSDESHRMCRARLARTFAARDRGFARLWRLHPAFIAQLSARCRDRTRRIHSAMIARG